MYYCVVRVGAADGGRTGGRGLYTILTRSTLSVALSRSVFGRRRPALAVAEVAGAHV